MPENPTHERHCLKAKWQFLSFVGIAAKNQDEYQRYHYKLVIRYKFAKDGYEKFPIGRASGRVICASSVVSKW